MTSRAMDTTTTTTTPPAAYALTTMLVSMALPFVML